MANFSLAIRFKYALVSYSPMIKVEDVKCDSEKNGKL